MALDDTPADELLVARALSGDRNAYAILVRRYGPRIKQAARGFGLSEADSDDVVQESFLAAWRGLAGYDRRRPLRSWLLQIALNKMRDLRRYRRVREFFFGATVIDELDNGGSFSADEPSPERIVIAKVDLRKVVGSLDCLDLRSREIVTLHHLVGLTQPETAEALGISLKAVEARLARARVKLASAFSKNATDAEGGAVTSAVFFFGRSVPCR